MMWWSKAGRQLRAAFEPINRPILGLMVSIALTFAVGKLLPDGYAPLDLYEFDLLAQTLMEKDTYSPKIVLVTIGDDEYEKFFQRESPLKPARVRAFIKAILTFQPSVVGVDLITDHWDDSLRDFSKHINNDTSSGTRVPGRPPARFVWAATTPPVARVSSPSTPPLTLPCFAIPQYKQDPDGTIRRQVLTVGEPGSFVPSLALAVSRSAKGEPCRSAKAGDKGESDDRIRFTGTDHLFRRFPAAKVLEDAREKKDLDNPSPLEMELEGAIVLLGGTFEEARDRYKTPIGRKDGVEILAHAVESLYNPIRTWPPLAVAVFEFVIGAIVIVGLARVSMPRWLQSLAMIVAPLVLGLVVSFYAFQYLGNVIAVAASFLGIPIGHFAEHWLGDQFENEGGHRRRPRQKRT